MGLLKLVFVDADIPQQFLGVFFLGIGLPDLLPLLVVLILDVCAELADFEVQLLAALHLHLDVADVLLLNRTQDEELDNCEELLKTVLQLVLHLLALGLDLLLRVPGLDFEIFEVLLVPLLQAVGGFLAVVDVLDLSLLSE